MRDMTKTQITTTEEREDVLAIMSDLHKDVYGFRPRNVDYDSFTNEELAEEYDFLCVRLQEEMEEERRWKSHNIKEFHKGLVKTMDCANCDHVTAIRYMFDAYISDRGFDYLSIQGFSYANNFAHTRYARVIENILDRIVKGDLDYYHSFQADFFE
jgi:hypothetical protein